MNETRPVPDALLERYLLGELPPGQMEALQRRAQVEAELQARIETLRASDEAVLKAYSSRGMAEAIAARRRSRVPAAKRFAAKRTAGIPFYRRRLFAVPAGLALACAVLLTVRPDGGNGKQGIMEVTETAEEFGTRLKGAEAGLAIFRKTRAGSELLPPRSLAKPGDTLQVFYHCRTAGYGVVFSVDGSGAVTLHYPEAEGPAAALHAGGMQPLPHAFKLDKAPLLERFFLITSAQTFSSEGILAQARAAFAVERAVPDSLMGLENRFRQYPYTLRKPVPGKRKETAP